MIKEQVDRLLVNLGLTFDYTLGIDVSKWQSEMNWGIASAAGAKFAFIRAGSINNVTGVCYTDYQFIRNARLAPEYMPIGFYWYFRPQHDPIKQANYFCDLIEQKDYKMQPVLDLEATGGKTATYITKVAGYFVLRVQERLGVLPILYSRAYWLNRYTVPDPLMKLLNLWIARYTSKGKPWGNILPWPDSPSIKPRDYNEWLFWQWSADGNGRGPEFGASSKSIDLNRFNGTQGDLDRYVGVEEPPLPATLGVKINVEYPKGVDVKYEGKVYR